MITGRRELKIELVRIGNSRGIRIPKPLIKHLCFGDTVEVRIEDESLVIVRERSPREGWREAFRSAGSGTDDELALQTMPENEFDRNEWQW